MPKKALLEAFSMVWNHKKLWIMGIFISLTSALEEIEFLRKLPLPNLQENTPSFWSQLQNTGLFSKQGIKGFVNLFESRPFSFFQILFIFAIILGIVIFIFYLSVSSQGAIIQAVYHPSKIAQEKIPKMLKRARHSFWPLATLNIFAKLIIAFMLFVFTSALKTPSLFLNILYLAILAVLYLGISFILKYAICGIIIKQAGIFYSLRNTISIIRKNFLKCFALSLALLLIYIIATVIITLLIFLIFLPFSLIMMATFILKIPLAIIITFSLFTIIATALFIVLYGFLSASSWSAWTKFYLSIEKKYE